jgi:hypothetical protein
MPMDPVPWLVEGGAHHSAEVARLLAHVATGGQEGVLAATDLRCLALSTPGSTVRVMPGACVIRNRALSSEQQSYMGRCSVEDDTLAIPASGSAGARTHLVIVRVENTYISGEPWAAPPDVEDGPYIYPRVLQDVPIGTRSVHELGLAYSAITLSRITVPANTATITGSMLTDLRSVVNPLTGPAGPQGPAGPPGEGEDVDEITEKQYFAVKSHVGDATTDDLAGATGSTWYNWPVAADWIVSIPTWATGADIALTVSGLRQQNGGLWGLSRMQIGNGAANTPGVYYDYTTDGVINGWTGHTMTAAGSVDIPSSVRGKATRFRAQAQITGRESSGTAKLQWRRGSVAILQIVFKQNPSLS